MSGKAYPTKREAREALGADGYIPAHQPPASPATPWVKTVNGVTDRRAIYGNDTVGWRIVAYPTLDWLE